MDNLQIDINSPGMILLGMAIMLLLLLVPLYLRPIWKVRKAVRKQTYLSQDEEPGCQPVSVIVFASDDSEALKRLLPTILGQRYNGPFEVIVVNEGQSDATVEVVERLKMIHNNLYLTFTPDGARQLSRKKLGLMIGIKAARYPIVVHTTAAAEISSENWLSRMTSPFVDPMVEVVIGYSHIDWSKDSGLGRGCRLFNSTADDIVWINAGLCGHPYRGTELNLAYTREVFFNNRGFSRSLNLKYGDDDIFVKEIASRRNTRLVLDDQTFVKRNAYNVRRLYNEMRSRYYFTGRHLPHLGRRMQALGSLFLWGIVGLCVAAALMGLPNLFVPILAAVIVLVTFIIGMVLWRAAIKALTGRKLLLSLPWLMLMRPFSNLSASIKSARHRQSNFTWK